MPSDDRLIRSFLEPNGITLPLFSNQPMNFAKLGPMVDIGTPTERYVSHHQPLTRIDIHAGRRRNQIKDRNGALL